LQQDSKDISQHQVMKLHEQEVSRATREVWVALGVYFAPVNPKSFMPGEMGSD
jgi:hypothetical protein